MRLTLQIYFLLLILTMANGQKIINKNSLPSIEYSVTTEINYADNKNMAQTLQMNIFIQLLHKIQVILKKLIKY